MRTRLALVLLCMSPVVAMAQRVTGTVRAGGALTPISGAVVTTLDSAGRAVARTLSDRSGRYSLPLAANAARLRAVRIGFAPFVVEISRGGGDVTLDLTMERAPVMLATVRITSDVSCGNAANASVALDVWEQARSALLAAIVARESNPARVNLLEYQRRMQLTRRVITDQRLITTSGMSSRPFAAALSGRQLATGGYRSNERGDDIYFAPDADVLFDDSFSAAKCFGLVRGSRDRAGQVGLTFRPRRIQRDFIDVSGTLWLSAQNNELIDLEYRYTGMDAEAERVGAGGNMHFRNMPNGVVFIDSWSILVPIMTQNRERGYDGNQVLRTVVTALLETGGYVVAASWNDGTQWSGRLGGIRGVVREARSGAPMEGVAVSVPGASTATTNLGGYTLALPPGRYRLGLIDSTFAGYVEPRQQSRELVVGRSDTTVADFEVPSRESLLGELCRGYRGSGTSILLGLIEPGGRGLPERLIVRASWIASGSADLDLNRLRQADHVGIVGSSGRFYLCGLPERSSWITLRLEAGAVSIADTSLAPNSIEAPTKSGTRQVDWSIPASAFEAAVKGDAAVLTGRVTRAGAPIAGAEVWVVLNDTTVKTDSLGRFRVGGLKAGQQLIQVRHIGYAPKRDSVTLKAQQETTREFSMDDVPLLDTMRTVGKGRAYDVPRLQDFEKRRLSGMGGYFVSEDELRKHDGRSVAEILRNYTPGITFESFKGQLFLSSNSAPTRKSQIPNGPTGCWVAVYFDGVILYAGDPGLNPPDMKQFLATNLSGIEYYGGASTLPLQYKNNKNNCGTLLMWTRGK